jgi:DNA-binding transcriptional MerR regulator
MADVQTAIDIPKRALFKAAEVCELLQVQPYVLRSWEAEFPALGVAKTAGSPRVYRRQDVEQVLRIKQLLLVEGLTLAGARRKLEEESGPIAADVPIIDELIGRNTRERLTEVKRGLRSILDLLSNRAGAQEFRLSPPSGPSPAKGRPQPPRGKSGRGRHASGRSSASPRRKRSA